MTRTEDLVQLFRIHTELGENATVHLPLDTAIDIADEIKERDKMIEQLKKQVDWLAYELRERSDLSLLEWRDAAQKAVSNE